MRQVELTRPDRANALDEALIDEVLSELATAEKERAPLLLTAAGDRHFCAGFDLTLVEQGPTEAANALFRLLTPLAQRTVPMTCIVNGAARGAGVMIAALCDHVVALPQATFGLPEIRMGLPSFAALELLSLRLAPGAAFAMVASGTSIDANIARARGLVDEIVERDAADGHVKSLARSVWTPAGLAAFAALRSGYADRAVAAVLRARERTQDWLRQG